MFLTVTESIETVEENTKYENEIKRLNYINSKLLAEVNELKNGINCSGSSISSDMPQILSMPSTVFSSLARKVTNQITTQLSSSDNSGNSNSGSNANHSGVSGAAAITLSQFLDTDTLDDSMRKVNKYVRKS